VYLTIKRKTENEDGHEVLLLIRKEITRDSQAIQNKLAKFKPVGRSKKPITNTVAL